MDTVYTGNTANCVPYRQYSQPVLFMGNIRNHPGQSCTRSVHDQARVANECTILCECQGEKSLRRRAASSWKSHELARVPLWGINGPMAAMRCPGNRAGVRRPAGDYPSNRLERIWCMSGSQRFIEVHPYVSRSAAIHGKNAKPLISLATHGHLHRGFGWRISCLFHTGMVFSGKLPA
jgi:hypothetical protein